MSKAIMAGAGSVLMLVVSMIAGSCGIAGEISASDKTRVVAAGLWEVSASHQSIALKVGPEDTKPFFATSTRRYMVCRAEKNVAAGLGQSDHLVRGVVGGEDPSAVALVFFDKKPAEDTGRIQTLMEIYRGNLASDFTITTVIDDPRSYQPKVSGDLVPMFSRTLERLVRHGDCPSDMKPGDYRELPAT